MSKYTHITKDGMILEVGYDKPMDYIFVQVIKNNNYLYSNINDYEIDFTCQTDFSHFDRKMKEMKIEIPEELKVKTLQDRANYISTLESFPCQIISSRSEFLEKEHKGKFAILIYQNIPYRDENLRSELFDKESDAIARMNQINGACIDDWDDL